MRSVSRLLTFVLAALALAVMPAAGAETEQRVVMTIGNIPGWPCASDQKYQFTRFSEFRSGTMQPSRLNGLVKEQSEALSFKVTLV